MRQVLSDVSVVDVAAQLGGTCAAIDKSAKAPTDIHAFTHDVTYGGLR